MKHAEYLKRVGRYLLATRDKGMIFGLLRRCRFRWIVWTRARARPTLCQVSIGFRYFRWRMSADPLV